MGNDQYKDLSLNRKTTLDSRKAFLPEKETFRKKGPFNRKSKLNHAKEQFYQTKGDLPSP